MSGIKDKFPAMPDDMRERIEAAVAAQVSADKQEKVVSYHTVRRRHLPAAVVAATLLFGITVFGAGSWLYHLKGEGVGDFGLATAVTVEEAGDDARIPNVTLTYGYIPEDMVCPENAPLKLYHADTPWQGGISAALIPLDTDFDEKELMVDRAVTSHETMMAGNHEAVYLENYRNPDVSPASIAFDKKMYIVFNDVRHVLVLYGGSDISKAEMLQIAEGISLQPGEGYVDDNVYAWSDFVSQMPETEKTSEAAADIPSLTADQMALVRHPGDKVLTTIAGHKAGEDWVESSAEISVDQVTISDNIGHLSRPERIPEDWEPLIDENGNLKASVRNYILPGDGISSLDETVKSDPIGLKLVEADITFSNTGDKDLEDVLFYIGMLRIREDDGRYYDFDQALESDGQTVTYPWWRDEMKYYDIYDEDGSQNGDNYIDLLPAGEAVTIHFAWIVAEDELQSLYLDLEGGMYDVFEKPDHLDKIVDIRQQ